MSAVKVLISGDCLGGFDALFKKVAAVNKKNGPFDLLVCVGQFFEESSDDGGVPAALQKFVDGSAQLPVKTYFIGGYGKGSAATLAALQQPPKHGGDRNLHYLGRSGVTQLEALNVAFLDGTYSHRAFHAKPPAPKLPPPPSVAAAADGDAAAAAGEDGGAAAGAEQDAAMADAAAAAAAGEAPKSPQQQQNGDAAPGAEAGAMQEDTTAAAAAGEAAEAPTEQQEEQEAGTEAAGAAGAAGEAAGANGKQQDEDAAGAAASGAAGGGVDNPVAAAAAEKMHAAAARARKRQEEQAKAAAKQAAVQAAAEQVCRHYNQSDVARLRHQLMVLPGEVDLLLTCEWPTGVLQQLPAGQDKVPGFDPRFTGNTAAELATLARPRYHVAGGQSLFYTRLPYANPDLGAGPRATRFVSLGSVIPRLKLSGAAAAAAADKAAAAAAAAVAEGIIGPSGVVVPAAGAGGAGGAAGGGNKSSRAGIGHTGGGGGEGAGAGGDAAQAAAMAAAAASTAAAATAAATAVAEAAKQQKFLHALALVPASSMSMEQLGTLPEGCGKYPYEKQKQDQVGQKRSGSTYDHDAIGEHCSWRWLPPKRPRGGFAGMATGGPPFQPWGKPGVVKDSAKSVFVRNLPFEATYEDVAGFFSQAGEVEDIRRQAQQDSGRPQPWCHVQFTDYGAVPAACALNGSRFMGREVMVATSTPLNKDLGGDRAQGAQALPDWRMELDGLPPGVEFPGPPGSGSGNQQQHGGRGPQRGRGRGGRGGHRGGHGHHQQQRHPEPEPGKPVEGCWFCLSSEQVDVDLVSSVGDEVYLALDKGPISPQHALIIPIEHHPSLAALPAEAAKEVGRYLSALRTAAASAGQQLVGFERYLRLRSKGGNHTHINTLPISKESGDSAAEVFKDMGAQSGLEFQPIPCVDGQMDLSVLQQVVGHSEYFLGILPDGSGLAAPLNPAFKAPIQLGRQVLAQLAGAPERADWKACTYSGDEEKAAADAFREYFKPFDIMATE